jgi:type I restriction enzyme R subunit
MFTEFVIKMGKAEKQSNFEFLSEHDPVFFQLASTAERVFSGDPNTTLIKLRQLGEAGRAHKTKTQKQHPHEKTGKVEMARRAVRAWLASGR